MKTRLFPSPWLPLALALVLTPPGAAQAPAGRVVAVGDIHGAADEFRSLLRRAGLIDEAGAWIAGSRTTFVQTGDFTDRGTGTRAVMDALMDLEKRAAAAGATIHVLLGNHEVMNLVGELRDVTPEIFGTFADAQSEERREKAWGEYERFTGTRRSRLNRLAPEPQTREVWMAAHPPGYFEYREAFEPDGRYGRWLREHDAIVQVGDSIFLHGGLHPQMAPSKIEDLNKQVERELKQFDDFRRHMISRGLILPFFDIQEMAEAARIELQVIAESGGNGLGGAADYPRHLSVLQGIVRMGTWAILNPNGPLWFRGFAMWSSAEGAPEIGKLLEKYHARRFVVGHTIMSGFRVTPRFDRRVFLIDTGMLSSHYTGGRASALEISGERITAVYEDGRQVLEGADAGAAAPAEEVAVSW